MAVYAQDVIDVVNEARKGGPTSIRFETPTTRGHVITSILTEIVNGERLVIIELDEGNPKEAVAL